MYFVSHYALASSNVPDIMLLNFLLKKKKRKDLLLVQAQLGGHEA